MGCSVVSQTAEFASTAFSERQRAGELIHIDTKKLGQAARAAPRLQTPGQTELLIAASNWRSTGFIPIPDHIALCTSNRGEANAIRHGFASRFMRSIPFELVIPLPPPCREGS